MRASGSYVPTYVRVLPPCLGAPLLSCAPLSLASLLDANLYPPPWPLQTKRKGMNRFAARQMWITPDLPHGLGETIQS